MSIVDLVRLDRLGPVLAQTTGDGRWRTLDASLIAGGKSNLTFEVTSEAGVVILRRPPSGELLPSAHDMGREARIQIALADTSVPVPKVVFQEPSGDILGVPFYVMEKVPGHVIRAEMPDGYAESPPEKLALAAARVAGLAALHTVGPEAVGLGRPGRRRLPAEWPGGWGEGCGPGPLRLREATRLRRSSFLAWLTNTSPTSRLPRSTTRSTTKVAQRCTDVSRPCSYKNNSST